jgi:hypothetical protein
MAEVLYMDGDTPQEQCLEKKVYYKVISGAFAYRIQMNGSYVLTPQDFMRQSRHISVMSI